MKLIDLFTGPPAREEVTALLGTPERYYVQELSGKDKAAWVRGNVEDVGTSDVRLVILALVDEGGRRVFTAHDLEDLSRGSALVGKLASVAAGVSALFWKPELKNGATTSPSNGPPGRGVVPSASSSPA